MIGQAAAELGNVEWTSPGVAVINKLDNMFKPLNSGLTCIMCSVIGHSYYFCNVLHEL